MMRKPFWCLCFIFAGGLSAAEPEVRCYRMGWMWMGRARWGIGDPFGEEGSFEEEPFWKPVDEAGFESRFLMEAGRLRDCRTFFARMLGEETAGQAVYDLKQERLVVRAAAADHDAFAEGMRNVIPLQIKVQVSLFEMPFESAQEMGAFWEKAPPEATELASLISLAVPGETATARTTGEALFVESECQVDQGDEYLELRLIARSRKKGQSFVVMSGYTIPLGVTWVEKVGSVDGKKSLVMTITPDLLLSSGVRVDEWILKEEGGAFLREERLRRMRWRPEEKEEPKKEGGKVSRNFTVPPTFYTFMLHSKEIESGRKMKRPNFKTGVTVESGQSLVVQESRVDGKRRAWVLTARVVSMDRELDRFLGEGK